MLATLDGRRPVAGFFLAGGLGPLPRLRTWKAVGFFCLAILVILRYVSGLVTF